MAHRSDSIGRPFGASFGQLGGAGLTGPGVQFGGLGELEKMQLHHSMQDSRPDNSSRERMELLAKLIMFLIEEMRMMDSQELSVPTGFPQVDD